MPRPPRADAAGVNVVVRFSPDELAAARDLALHRRDKSLSHLVRALVADAYAAIPFGRRARRRKGKL